MKYEQIKHEFVCEERGAIHVKGKGEMDVWHVIGPRTEESTVQEVIHTPGTVRLTEGS